MQLDQMRAGGSPDASVRVPELATMLARTEELIGKVVVPKTQMESSAFAFIAAPDENLIGLQSVQVSPYGSLRSQTDRSPPARGL
jgi:predicted enzyme related to lactoylglutathione lyase